MSIEDNVLDFLQSTHVGRTAPPMEENRDSEEEAEEAEMGGEDLFFCLIILAFSPCETMATHYKNRFLKGSVTATQHPNKEIRESHQEIRNSHQK